MSNYIIDEIQPTAWRLRIRDESTGKTEEVALRPGEPWKVRVGGAPKPKPEPSDKRPAAETPKPEQVPTPASSSEKSTEPLPKDLKLALENGSGNTVVATAHGRGAAAWVKTQKRLLGRKWEETTEGNPFVMLRNSPTLLEDLERALPGIRLDTKHYTPPEAPAVKETKETKETKKSEEPEETKKAETPATEEIKHAETPAAKKTKKPARADKPARKGKNAGKPPKLQPGAGPGGLEWSETRDAGNRAIVAPWQEGHFKILRAGSGVYALFYEYERGGYEQLACGKPDELKQVASARTSGKGQRVTEALARGACNTCAPAPAEPAANESPKRSPRATVRAAEPVPEPTPAPEPIPAPAPAEPIPPTSDAARDAELMSGFRKELAGIFDEDDE